MELLQETCPLIELYNKLEVPYIFSLVDVGCSGGIDPIFKKIGGGEYVQFRALGIDASVDEIERLRRENTDQRIYYIDGIVGLEEGHPFINELGKRSWWGNTPWERLSAYRSTLFRENSQCIQTHEQKMHHNQWQSTRLSGNLITLADTITGRCFSDVDLLKIDIDGPDFMAMQSLHKRFDEFGILAVVMEINYNGSDYPTDHTFHNTDRFMRKNGFELFGLTIRPYSTSSLPFRFLYNFPAQTTYGRPIQGDALYMRDICSTSSPVPNILLTPKKLINAVLLFSIFGLPDCAAEILLAHKEKLDSFLDITAFLNALTRQSVSMQYGTPSDVSNYRELMALYENDSPAFYMAGDNFKYKMLAQNYENQKTFIDKEELRIPSKADRVVEILRQHRIIWFFTLGAYKVSAKLYKILRAIKRRLL